MDNPPVLLTQAEQEFILSHPKGLRLLMDYHDMQYTEGSAVLELEDIPPWPTPRWLELRDRGAEIIAQDPDIWNPSILRDFGVPVRHEEDDNTDQEDYGEEYNVLYASIAEVLGDYGFDDNIEEVVDTVVDIMDDGHFDTHSLRCLLEALEQAKE